jgi:hypothetical protein
MGHHQRKIMAISRSMRIIKQGREPSQSSGLTGLRPRKLFIKNPNAATLRQMADDVCRQSSTQRRMDITRTYGR